jgi:hypothetical protein
MKTICAKEGSVHPEAQPGAQLKEVFIEATFAFPGRAKKVLAAQA